MYPMGTRGVPRVTHAGGVLWERSIWHSDQVTGDLREIGFNNDVDRGARRLHVQTEVIGGPMPKVRTTVLENGTVRHVESYNCTAETLDEQRAREIAQAQHNNVLNRVARGEIG